MPDCAIDWNAFMNLSNRNVSTSGRTDDTFTIFHASVRAAGLPDESGTTPLH